MRFWRQALEVTRKDLLVERRTAEVLAVTAPFGAVALLFVPLAVGVTEPDSELLTRIGPGMYWLVVLLFGVLVILRRSASDGPPQRDLVRLLGVEPGARFAGDALATGLLLLLFEAVLAPVAIAFYNPDLTGWPWLLLIAPLVAAGLAMLGTIAAGVTVSLPTRTSLTALLVVPLAVPLLLAATSALEGLRIGRSILAWLLLLVVMDLVLAVAGVLTAQPLEEASR